MTETLPHFTQRVEYYAKYRPHYPRAVLDLLKSECGLTSAHIIADVGSGTGFLTELFLENGNPVFGIEPDPDMRVAAEYYLQSFPNFTSIAAPAEATTLPNQSVDFLTAGQAFHWFNIEQTKKEFARVLKTNGWVALVWNARRTSGTPFLVVLEEFWQTKQFWKNSSSRQTTQQLERTQMYRLNRELVERELLIPFFESGGFNEAVFENPMLCDFQSLKGQVLSGGPALEPDDPYYAVMLETLERIFQTHQVNGTVTIEHNAHVIYGQLLKGRKPI